jgi:hypothetical protein
VPASAASSAAGASSPSNGASSSAGTGATASASPTAKLPFAQIELPAPKAGFATRVHRGLVFKVNLTPPAPPSANPLSYSLEPVGSKFVAPIAGADGFFNSVADGVVTIHVKQGTIELGKVTVTVWG